MITAQKAEEKCKNIQKWTKNTTVVEVEDKSRGCDQEVKVIHLCHKQKNCTKNQKVIMKIPLREKDKILHEVVGCQKSEEVGIPVPKIFYYDDQCLIQQHKGSKDMAQSRSSKKNSKKLYKQLGIYLKRLHSVKGKGHGNIQNKRLVGKQKNATHRFKEVQDSIEAFENLEYYPQSFIQKIKEYYNENKFFLFTKEASLLHGDYSEDNIISDGKNIQAIIDFGDLGLGSPMQDFARMFVHHRNTYKFEAFLEGYGAHNIEQIKFYVFILCLWIMEGIIKSKNFRKIRKFEKALKYVVNSQQ